MLSSAVFDPPQFNTPAADSALIADYLHRDARRPFTQQRRLLSPLFQTLSWDDVERYADILTAPTLADALQQIGSPAARNIHEALDEHPAWIIQSLPGRFDASENPIVLVRTIQPFFASISTSNAIEPAAIRTCSDGGVTRNKNLSEDCRRRACASG